MVCEPDDYCTAVPCSNPTLAQTPVNSVIYVLGGDHHLVWDSTRGYPLKGGSGKKKYIKYNEHSSILKKPFSTRKNTSYPILELTYIIQQKYVQYV
jgi:hypothetical protein